MNELDIVAQSNIYYLIAGLVSVTMRTFWCILIKEHK